MGTLNGCTQAITLRTPASAAWKMQLVFDRLPVVEAVVDVHTSFDEADTIFTQLSDLFEFAEIEAIARYRRWQIEHQGGPVPFPLNASAEARRAAPLEIRRLVRPLRESDSAVYYLEAIKRFPPPPEGGGDLLGLSGWIRRVGGKMSAIDVIAGPNYSDEDKSDHPEPLGIVRAGGRSFWISYVHQYESGAVTVIEVSDDRVGLVIVVDVGGC